jgi:hypothetical protein
MIFVAVVMSMFIIQGTLGADELSLSTGPEISAMEAQKELDDLLAYIEANSSAVVDDLVNSLADDEGTAEQLRATLESLSTFTLAEIVQNAATLDDVTIIMTGKTPEELNEEIFRLGDPDKDFSYTPVTPCRIIDTRNAGGPFSPDETREYYVYGPGTTMLGQGGNPAGCESPKLEPRAVHINVAVVPVSNQGHFRAYPANIGPPNASIINYRAGVQNIANAVTVKTYYQIGPREIEFLNKVGTADLVVDIMGYYHEAHPAGADSASGNASIDLTSTPMTVKSVIINAPLASLVIVHASGTFHLLGQFTLDWGGCSIVHGSSTDTDSTHYIAVREAGSHDMVSVPFAGTRKFYVGAGLNTFRLNCVSSGGELSVSDPTITAIWFPRTY